MTPVKIRHAVAVDYFGSISQAAQSLNVTQSAVTKSVAEVESGLGYKLFERRARGMVTTEAGREFLDRASRILSDFDQLLSSAKAGGKLEDRLFRVGVAPPGMQGLIAGAVQKVIASSRSVRVHVSAGRADRMLAQFKRGDIDLLLALEESLIDQSGIEKINLAPFCLVFFVRPDHPLANRKAVTPEDIAKFPFIAGDIPNTHVESLMQLSREKHDDPTYLFHSMEYFPALAEIVSKSDVVGLVQEAYASSRSFQSRFATIDSVRGPEMRFQVAFSPQTTKTRYIERFVNALPREGSGRW